MYVRVACRHTHTHTLKQKSEVCVLSVSVRVCEYIYVYNVHTYACTGHVWPQNAYTQLYIHTCMSDKEVKSLTEAYAYHTQTHIHTDHTQTHYPPYECHT